MQPKRISSPANATVKEAARLKRKRYRHERRMFLTEGEDLLDAALRRGVVPRQVFVLDGEEEPVIESLEEASAPGPGRPRPQIELYICSEAVLARLSEMGSGSRVISVFEMTDGKFPAGMDRVLGGAGPVIYLAGAGDPGNVGTIMRSASALGAIAVVLGPGSADPYSPKALRATMGAIFQVPFYLTVNPDTLVSWAARARLGIICTDAHAGIDVWKAPMEGTFILVMGSEREGIPHRLLDAASETVRIPQIGEAESLNVAMAGTVILYEALRQRSPGRQ